MAKLYFKYGAMGSSKTAQALMTKFNYEEKGYKVWLIKPAADTRDDEVNPEGNIRSLVKSRIGLSAEAQVINSNDDIFRMYERLTCGVNVIIADEAQFFTELQIYQLRNIVLHYNIPVLCFGLRTDFQAKLFPGSKTLFELSDSISEIKSICKCGEKAIINARLDKNGKATVFGEQVCIGGNDKYIGMCYKCWKKSLNS